MIINAREFGIISGQDAARPLVKLAEYLKAAQSHRHEREPRLCIKDSRV